MSGAVVVLEKLSAWFGATAALREVSLALEPGRIHALLGPSGCGKTTLLRLLAGLLRPSQGRVWLDGVDVTALPTERRGVVLVNQEPLLFPAMTALQNVAYAARARGEPRAVAESEAAQVLAQVQLAHLAQRLPSALSGGEQQRVALARALVARPRVLLLDEPLSALDAGLREQMRALIVQLQQASGLTLVVVTHDQREAASLGHRLSVMAGGQVLQTATPAELHRAPATEAVARFLGAENFHDATIEGRLATTALGPLSLATAPAPGPARLCIWPQDVALGPGPNPVLARVLSLRFNGAEQRVSLGVGPARLELVAPRFAALAEGEAVMVHLPPERIVVLPGPPRSAP